ncbi:hypothetical protein PG997_012961 [Apiospora hydei]|uniref:2EXR domain-containing protein n=1 Tax=Apiospora hydei TaxID=1337664 RepID=A0ABR1V825_9PEZI
MRVFHPFSRLPPELRQRIWSLSIKLQDLAVHSLWGPPSLYKQPALLYACSESRNYLLQRHYVPALSDPQRLGLPHQWLNLEVDTVWALYPALMRVYPIEHLQAQNLVIGNAFNQDFFDLCHSELKRMPALRNVTVIANFSHRDSLDPHVRDGYWWLPWTPVLESLYYNGKGAPAPYRLCVAAPKTDHTWELSELNPDNYRERYRAEARIICPNVW